MNGGKSVSARQAVAVLSVSDVLEKTRQDDGWKLSVAQRAFEWDPRRVTNLVDSLLRGFPIGTLLLHRTRRPFFEMDTRETLRTVQSSEQTTDQLIDGQQRCQALMASFGKVGLLDPKSGELLHLWINVAEENSANREFHDELGQKYFFHWSLAPSGLNALSKEERRLEDFPPRAPRAGWIRFSKLLDFIQAGEDATAILNEAEVPDPSKDPKRLVAALRREVQIALSDRRIPVHVLEDKATDVYDAHQLFIRINTGGIMLGQADIFFAAVKKYWLDAEEHLRPLVEPPSLLFRRDAISLLARCAGLSLKQRPFDPVRLHPTDLVKEGTGEASPLVRRMKELTSGDQLAPSAGIQQISVSSHVVHDSMSASPAAPGDAPQAQFAQMRAPDGFLRITGFVLYFNPCACIRTTIFCGASVWAVDRLDRVTYS